MEIGKFYLWTDKYTNKMIVLWKQDCVQIVETSNKYQQKILDQNFNSGRFAQPFPTKYIEEMTLMDNQDELKARFL